MLSTVLAMSDITIYPAHKFAKDSWWQDAGEINRKIQKALPKSLGKNVFMEYYLVEKIQTIAGKKIEAW